MKIKSLIGILTIFTLIAVSCNEDEIETDELEVPVPEGYSLIWNDEFNEETINPENWTYETGDGTDFGLPKGWGNSELQIYTNSEENSSIVEEGDVSALAITAMENGSDEYTSAKLTTQNLFSMRFGRIEVKAKMPEGQGIWPAIWMLGDNRDQVDWPGCGEIDIMEMLGNEPGTMYSTLHYTNSENRKGEDQGMKQSSGANFNESYHIYSLEWTPESLSFAVDGEHFHEVAIEDGMKEFQRSFYLILNVAVGGFWPGYPDETTTFPQTMYIDYVRAYSNDGLELPAEPTLDVEEETIGQILEPNIADNAIKDGFDNLGNIEIIAYGGGGEPLIDTSESAVDGDLSLKLDYQGGNWGGAYIEMEQPADISEFTHLTFSLNKPESLVDAEIKLESTDSDATVYLKDYTSTTLENGFEEYVIPLSDFEGLNLNNLNIPFALWNPVNDNAEFVEATVLVDNVHFSNN